MPKRPLTAEQNADNSLKKAKIESERARYKLWKSLAQEFPKLKSVQVDEATYFVCALSGALITVAYQIAIPTSPTTYTLVGCYKNVYSGFVHLRKKLFNYPQLDFSEVLERAIELGLPNKDMYHELKDPQGLHKVPSNLNQANTENPTLVHAKYPSTNVVDYENRAKERREQAKMTQKEIKRPSYRVDSLSINPGAEWEPLIADDVIFAVPVDIQADQNDHEVIVFSKKNINFEPCEDVRLLMIGRSVNLLNKTAKLVVDRDHSNHSSDKGSNDEEELEDGELEEEIEKMIVRDKPLKAK